MDFERFTGFRPIVPHFSPDANNFFAFLKNFFQGDRISLVAAATICQNLTNRGPRSLPAVRSNRPMPRKIPTKHTGRSSPPQTRKVSSSTPSARASRKRASARPVCLGRRGRRKPYSSPRGKPMCTDARKNSSARPGSVSPAAVAATRPHGSHSHRTWREPSR